MHRAGRQDQLELEGVTERTVAEGQFVVNRQRVESDRRRPGGTAEHACLVLLCTLQRAAPIVEGCNGMQAAGCGGS